MSLKNTANSYFTSSKNYINKNIDTIFIIASFLITYIPTLFDLFYGIWSTDEQGHGPLILLVVIWMLYNSINKIQKKQTFISSAFGMLIFMAGIIIYIIGRSQDIIIFEVGSSILLMLASFLLLYGATSIRAVAFPIFFMIFMLPLPGAVVDAVTMPMKIAVSYSAEKILNFLAYPIARQGVILQIGQYQLLVADACAGLHTLFTLEALGLLYLNIIKHSSAFRNIFLATFIIPISFSANVVRVIILTLVTYYFGDAAGQGFVHGFAGFVLFLSALIFIISVDSILRTISRHIINN